MELLAKLYHINYARQSSQIPTWKTYLFSLLRSCDIPRISTVKSIREVFDPWNCCPKPNRCRPPRIFRWNFVGLLYLSQAYFTWRWIKSDKRLCDSVHEKFLVFKMWIEWRRTIEFIFMLSFRIIPLLSYTHHILGFSNISTASMLSKFGLIIVLIYV